jgi:hypothetical protein
VYPGGDRLTQIRYENALSLADDAGHAKVPRMRNTLQLTLTDQRFTLTPLPLQTAHVCMSRWNCRNVASHRISSRRPAAIVMLCDDHTIEWTLNQALSITARKPAA